MGLGTRETACAPALSATGAPSRDTPCSRFIDFWIENSVHAAERNGALGAEQDASALTSRCVDMASSLGLSNAALEQEHGDPAAYINAKLMTANALERDQRTYTTSITA